ncbi:Alcohol acetyltransferase [Fusarium irregulare]|uniref:Alcohol acetyltransferase n=1 Tax=Fusarium irregulare TaxID=2494466 RepID=A0A9W8PD37_9HYPO|nr:Alcohol acetyltransferase [Fusarium irregulare]KAJ4009134.1 Alcohol acetyltransferase [Fusarium irregulare]
MDLYRGTSITCLYSIPESLRNPASHDDLVLTVELAVADTIDQHPLLQVGLVNERSKRAAWSRIGQVNFANHIERQLVNQLDNYHDSLRDLTQRHLDTKFGNRATRPGWRLVVLKLEGQNLLEIMFVWCHTNCDGTGGKIFHESLLRSLNSVMIGATQISLENHIYQTTASAQNMLPPQEVIAKYRITPKSALDSVWHELKPPIFVSKSTYVSWADITRTPCKTQLRTLTIGQTTLQKLLTACRSHKTTLTGLLHGIMLVCLVGQLPESKIASIMAETPLSLRRFIKPEAKASPTIDPKRLIGNYVTKMEHDFGKDLVNRIWRLIQTVDVEEQFTILEKDMWAAAILVRQEIQAKLELGLKNDLVGLMAVVGDWEKYMKDEMAKPRTASWLITNLGEIDGICKSEDRSCWSIQRSKFSLAAGVVSPMFNISVITAKGNDLCIDVSWQDGLIDSAIGDRLIEGIHKWLDYIARS